MMKKSLLLLASALTLALSQKAAWANLDGNCQRCESMSDQELVDASSDTSSKSDRAQIRVYLSRARAGTAAGHFGTAWVLSQNDAPSEEIIHHYEKAIELDPHLGTAYVNLSYEYTQADLEDKKSTLWDRAPRSVKSRLIFAANTVSEIKRSKGFDAVEPFLDQAVKRGDIPAYTRDFALAKELNFAGQVDRALDLFMRSYEASQEFDALEEWLNIRIQQVRQQGSDFEAFSDALRPALRHSQVTGDEEGYFYAAKVMRAEGRHRAAFRLFEAAYDLRPYAEAAQLGFFAASRFDIDMGEALLNRAVEDLPLNWRVYDNLAWSLSDFDFDLDRAIAAQERAVELAALQDDIRAAADYLASLHRLRGDFVSSQRVYERTLPRLEGSARRNLTANYATDRRMAEDWAKAEALSEDSSTYFSSKANSVFVPQIKSLVDARQQYLIENPFLVDWQNRFGQRVSLDVEFDSGKSVIKPEFYPELDQAARVLQGPLAQSYVFRIEGHTDSRGSDELNTRLSRERAEAVQDYFIRNAGIEPARLVADGFASRQPVSTNSTDVGRQRNRRVEILPYGNAGAPAIATSSYLDGENLRVSRDGRIAVTGSYPAQVWDARKRLKLFDLPYVTGTYEISPNGRYLAAASKMFTETSTIYYMRVFDLRTGTMVSQHPFAEPLISPSWSPQSDRIAFANSKGFLRIMDAQTGEITAIRRQSRKRAFAEVLWLQGGQYIAMAQRWRNTIGIWDTDGMELLGELDDVSFVHALGQSNDGRYLLATDNNHMLNIWDTKSWDRVYSSRTPIIADQILPHPVRNEVIMSSKFRGNVDLARFNLDSMEFEALHQGKREFGIGYSADGTSILAGDENGIEIRDARSLNETRAWPDLGDKGERLTLDAPRDLVISQDNAGSHVWDITTGTRAHSLRTRTEIGWYPVADGVFITANTNGQLVRFSTLDFTETVLGDVGFKAQKIEVGNRVALLAGQSYGASDVGEFRVLDLASWATVGGSTFDLVTRPIKYGHSEREQVLGIALDEAKNHVLIVPAWQDGTGRGLSYSRVAKLYDYRGAELGDLAYVKNNLDQDIKDARLNPDNGKWELQVRYFWRGFEKKGQVWQSTSATARSQQNRIALSDGSEILWSPSRVSYGDNAISFPQTLRDVVVHEDRNLIAGLTVSNELVLMDLKALKRVATVQIQKGGEWLTYTPSGYFDASLRGEEAAFWWLGDNYLPFQALRQTYAQPSLVRRSIQTALEQQSIVTPEPKPEVPSDLFKAPYELSLEGGDAVGADGAYTLRLKIKKLLPDLPDPEVHYTLNGRTVPDKRGFEEDAFFEEGETIGLARQFTLAEGDNVISASLKYRGALLQPVTVEVTRPKAPKPQHSLGLDTQLWFFGVGISDYEITTQNLEYAHRDAEELAKAFQKQEGTLYSKVNTMVLTNENASERNIRIQMNKFLRQASAQDVIIIFVAGHGIQDNEQQLYLVTHDGDIREPYTGMEISKFRDFIAARPLNQKALFLLDICHAGSTGAKKRGRISAEDAVRELSRGTGTVVFASSTGNQSSLESEDYGGGHGAFSAALLEALDGAADQNSGDQNAVNSVNEVIAFVSRRVPQMTQGQQHPTVPQIDNLLDFPLSTGR